MNRRGYTLVEMMVATALTLVIMVAVVNGFGFIGDKITNARAALEMSEELRGASARLIADLEGVTAPMTPPLSPGAGQGYFEITEGPGVAAVDNDAGGIPDTTVGDLDDYVMFTTRSRSAPFVGRYGAGATIESHEAEVAWFVRGRTLYRRVLLVAPNAAVSGNGTGFYAGNDISVRRDNSSGTIYANTLADLTRPETRFAHQPYHWYANSGSWGVGYPYHPHFCVAYNSAGNPVGVFGTVWASRGATNTKGRSLGLPTLAECSQNTADGSTTPPTAAWIAGGPLVAHGSASSGPPSGTAQSWPYEITEGAFDAWRNPHPWDTTYVATSTGSLKRYCNPDGTPAVNSPRMNEDIILNNVLSFDVKVWDPTARVIQIVRSSPASTIVVQPGDRGYTATALANATPGGATVSGVTYTIVGLGAYVDLNYAKNNAYSVFSGPQNNGANAAIASVYDTWSTHYDEGGTGTDGFDNGGVAGVVDDPDELLYPPPYSAQLRGVQIKIRTYEPSTRQIREVTVVHNFVSK